MILDLLGNNEIIGIDVTEIPDEYSQVSLYKYLKYFPVSEVDKICMGGQENNFGLIKKDQEREISRPIYYDDWGWWDRREIDDLLSEVLQGSVSQESQMQPVPIAQILNFKGVRYDNLVEMYLVMI